MDINGSRILVELVARDSAQLASICFLLVSAKIRCHCILHGMIVIGRLKKLGCPAWLEGWFWCLTLLEASFHIMSIVSWECKNSESKRPNSMAWGREDMGRFTTRPGHSSIAKLSQELNAEAQRYNSCKFISLARRSQILRNTSTA